MSRSPGKLPTANLTVRVVFAPVGTHETLLAYLVRRLLENEQHLVC